jgi:hypothetical protein
MKKFILRLFLFFMPFLIFAMVKDFLITSELKKSKTFAYGEYTVWNDLYKGEINSDLVVYGSSRAWLHLNPILIEKKLDITAYNIGIDGHNFWLQYLRHKTLLKHNKKPRYIILSVGPFTLQKREDLFNSNQFLPYMLLNKDIFDFTKSYNGFSLLDYIIPLKRYSGNLKVLFKSINNSFENHIGQSRIKGFMGADRQWTEDLENAKKRNPVYTVKFDRSTLDLFNDFMQECNELDIKVIMVYTPEYIEGQNYVVNRTEVIAKYQSISKNYEVPFLDYSNDTMSYVKDYFYNTLHLNKKGANLFTQKLIDDLNEIKIIQPERVK